jgi:ABC-2 type transport system ATP-binding protein
MHSTGIPPAIKVTNVTKTIKNRTLLDNVSFELPEGMIYGISGPNGSGKSMMLRVICGLVIPDQGDIEVLGDQIGKRREFPHQTGALIETPGFLNQYSGRENLRLLGMINGQITMADIRRILTVVGLDPDDKRPVRTYSTGMRQRLGLAQALMENPRLLILDEPTSGLDRAGVKEMHQKLKEFNTSGGSILLTSHSKEELELLCHRIFWVENGKIYALWDIEAGQLPDEDEAAVEAFV